MEKKTPTLLKVTLFSVFFTFLKLYKWYQIAQRTTYISYIIYIDCNNCNDSAYTVAIYYTNITPSMLFTLSRWGGLSTRKFQPECVNEESSTERRS